MSDAATFPAANSVQRAGAARPDVSWTRCTLAIAGLGAVLLWAALPPLEWASLAWIAPVPWLWLVRLKKLPPGHPLDCLPPQAGSRHGRLERINRRFTAWAAQPYIALWLVASAFWLASIHWIRLPHPALIVAWLALSLYSAIYLPLFVGLSRVAVHTLCIPLVLAAPVVWAGLELAKAHVMTGFLMGALSHTQYRRPVLMQISDLGGAYAVSFLIVLVAAALAALLPVDGERRRFWPLALAAAALAATIAYGRRELAAPPDGPGPRVALIQGAVPPDFKYDALRSQKTLLEHIELSERALREAGPKRPIGNQAAIAIEEALSTSQVSSLDLIVWPETMYRWPLVTIDGRDVDPARLEHATRTELARIVELLGAPVLFGLDAVDAESADLETGWRGYNSSVAVTRDGRIVGRYDKMHRVVFGEYIPFADWFPWLYSIGPLTGGIRAGEQPGAMRVGEFTYAPNICFETAVPHVIGRQVRTLREQGVEPDVLVNLTNDSWFRGSSELPMHLACGVYRAIEMRKPLVVAANEGISAWIDSGGRILKESPRRTPDVLIADVELDGRRSLYSRIGDWPAGVCLALCVGLAVVGWRARRRI